jgi:hypothetical protein
MNKLKQVGVFMSKTAKKNKEKQEKEVYRLGECPICGSKTEQYRPFGPEYCTKEDCPYDTSG